jgi:hypothetical protein
LETEIKPVDKIVRKVLKRRYENQQLKVTSVIPETHEVILFDSSTLTNYTNKISLDDRLVALLCKYLQKRQFTVEEHATAASVTLHAKMFAVSLNAIKTTQDDLFRYLKEVKAERDSIVRDTKLFEYFVMTSNQAKKHLYEKAIEDPMSLWEQQQGQFVMGQF